MVGGWDGVGRVYVGEWGAGVADGWETSGGVGGLVVYMGECKDEVEGWDYVQKKCDGQARCEWGRMYVGDVCGVRSMRSKGAVEAMMISIYKKGYVRESRRPTPIPHDHDQPAPPIPAASAKYQVRLAPSSRY